MKMLIREKVIKMKEYFKIEETLKIIKISKEEGSQEETITKNRINHLSTNVNLMREAQRFGEKQTKEEIIEKIEKVKVKVHKLWKEAVEENNKAFQDCTWHTFIYLKDLIKQIGADTKPLTSKGERK